MDLLDSLDVKQGGQKQKPKKSNTKRKENSKKATGEDILGFLDELESKKTPEPGASSNSEAASKQPEKKETSNSGEPASSNVKEGASGNTTTSDAEPSEEATGDANNEFVNPVSTLSGWWNRNKGDLWSKAQETFHSAAHDAVNQARQAEAMVDKSSFSFNALQTRLTTVLNTIVPPISQYEQLKIYVYHDMVAYPSVDELLYQVFDYVMDQVEGGGEPQLVSEKGKNRLAAADESNPSRSLNYVKGTLQEAAKLSRENIASLRNRNNTEKSTNETETNPKTSEEDVNRISEVYISIQPVVAKVPLLGEDSTEGEALYFVIVLDDSDHNVNLSTISQPLPVEWAQWLDSNGHGFKEAAIDPREWVFGWVEDALNLSFGVIAQKYVTTRMGLTHEKRVGE